MSFLDYFLGKRKHSAAIAKERLQIILTHERPGRGSSAATDYLPALKEELMAVIAKYVAIHPDQIQVTRESRDNCEVLALNIVLPELKGK